MTGASTSDPVRPELFKHNFAMRMLRWLMLRGEATQVEFMKEYKRIGAAGSSFGDDFGRFVVHDPHERGQRRVIAKTPIRPGAKRSKLTWVGPPAAAWLAATPDDELQRGYETLERAWIDTDDDHVRDWVFRLRTEIEARNNS